MYARGVAAKWQSRRKISLGPVRRACPASGEFQFKNGFLEEKRKERFFFSIIY